MAYQTVFKRYELKYLLTKAQKERILQVMKPYMRPDQYGRSTVRNVYFDNDSYQLIRRSIEKPEYKEKLRMRCYETATADSTVFVELKKKFRGVVYKRRLSLTQKDATAWLCASHPDKNDSQIAREITYFMQYYQGLKPKAFLSYAREAYYGKEDKEFRITFDDTVLFRQTDLSLTVPPSGTPLIGSDQVLMEIKCVGGIPLWLVQMLSEEKLYKQSFSKYGTAYTRVILPQLKEETKYA